MNFKTVFILLTSFISTIVFMLNNYGKNMEVLTNAEKRLKHLNTMCEKYKNFMPNIPLNPSRFVRNIDYGILGCLINKVGSTSFTQFFLKLDGIN